MKTPFEILNVSTDATDEAIRQAYLYKVKEFPPEQAPEQFKLIRTAYETIKTALQRVEYDVFHCELPETKDIVEQCFKQQTQRPTEDLLLKTLKATLTLGIDNQ